MKRERVPDVVTPDELYGLPPDEFIAARNALAKQLRADKRRADADDVAKLRRPPQSAWALNHLARTDPSDIEHFLRSAARLSEALTDDSPDLRDAQADFRSSIEVTVGAAAHGVGITDEGMRSRIRNIVLAASVDDAVAEQLHTGTVTDDHDAPGFTLVSGGAAHRSARPGRQVGGNALVDDDAADADEVAERRSRLTVIDGKADEQDRATRRSAQAERDRIKARTRLERQLEKLRATADRLADQAEAAEAKAQSLRSDADRAAAAVEEVEAELDDL